MEGSGEGGRGRWCACGAISLVCIYARAGVSVICQSYFLRVLVCDNDISAMIYLFSPVRCSLAQKRVCHTSSTL